MAILAGLALLTWLVVMVFVIGGTYLAYRQRSPGQTERTQALPPVSVLKPLKGLEPGLEENLESFFNLIYPEFELLFCVSSQNDPAALLVEDLRKRYPDVRSRLIVSTIQVGPNPKVNNLYGSYYRAIFDHIVISDSNVRVPKDYLSRLVSHLSKEVGVATSLIHGTGYSGVGGYLESAYLNATLVRLMSVGVWVGMPLVLGKSMCLQRSVAEQFGGLDFLGAYLAEDYMTGHAMRKLGLKAAMSSEPVSQYIGKRSIVAFWSRHLRWGRLRKAHSFSGFLAEPLTSAILPGVIFSWVVHRWTGISGIWPFVAHLAIWLGCDGFLLIQSDELSIGVVGAWFLRELVAFPLFVHTISGTSVEWRGHRLKLKRGGKLRITQVQPEEPLGLREPSLELPLEESWDAHSKVSASGPRRSTKS